MERIGKIINSNIHLYNIAVQYYKFKAGPIVYDYPSALNMELTTLCNSKCVFCAHEHFIKSGLRKNISMPYEEALRNLDWLDKYLMGKKPKEFIPVGLGEPLLYPYLPEILNMAKTKWPNVQTTINTNCIALTPKNFTKLINKDLDTITLSLCFSEPENHKKGMGIDAYTQVTTNIKNFLLAKGNYKPRACIHIFDTVENRPHLKEHITRWEPLLNANDMVRYVRMCDNTKKYVTKSKKSKCKQPEYMLMVGVDGTVYPCCTGVWRPNDGSLSLGNTYENPLTVRERAERFRKEIENGSFEKCQGCCQIEDISVSGLHAFQGFD